MSQPVSVVLLMLSSWEGLLGDVLEEQPVHGVRQSRNKSGMSQLMKGRVWGEEGEMGKAERQTRMQERAGCQGRQSRAKVLVEEVGFWCSLRVMPALSALDLCL